jgi:hypothetical protein
LLSRVSFRPWPASGHVVGSARLGTAVAGLIGSALAAQPGRGPFPPGSQEALRASVHAFIEQRLADPGLGPDMIAAAHHNSRRYLYQVFETEAHGAGVAAWIRQRR